eukprot:jgi/Ulvmu1/6539/UM003_0173.1
MTFTMPSRSADVGVVRRPTLSPAPMKPSPVFIPAPSRPEPLCMDQLVDFFMSGCTPEEDWRIGTEHEKLAFRRDDLSRATYQDIKHILQRMVTDYGWEPMHEGGNIIGCKANGQSITIETGGQLELSGAPVHNLHQMRAELSEHLRQARAAAADIGVQFLGLGYDPRSRAADLEYMPRDRYKLLGSYLGAHNDFGQELLFNTTTTQVNLDFSSEQDMIDKLRISLALQPAVIALFSNTPLRHGRDTGLSGWRSSIYLQIDPDRSGMMPFVFSPDFCFESYIDWALDARMIFTCRGGTYQDCRGDSFRDFINGNLASVPGEYATVDDFEVHLSTMWPEVRLKKFLEMRGADCGSEAMIAALPALWVGLLYDATARRECLSLISDWTVDDMAQQRQQVSVSGLRACAPGGTVADVAAELVRIARDGLRRRGLGEAMYLFPLDEIVATGESHADALARRFRNEWRGRMEPVFEHMEL